MYIPIGVTDTGKPFSIDSDYHATVEGMTGVGKSTLLKNLFVEFIRSGNGGCLIDPHGDLADQIAALIPKERRRDFIWIDPDADRVPGLNILHYDDPKDKERGVEAFLTIMKALAGSAWGDETGRVLTNAADSVMESYERPTPLPIFRFMADDAFRTTLLASSKNPFLAWFKEQYDDKLGDREQMSKFSPPINKVGKLMRPLILPIIAQERSLDFLDIMNRGKIVVCRFSKGRLGEETAQILGSLVVSMISIAGLRREKQKERRPFMLMADEVANFVHGGRFGTLLAEARKYGISLVTAFQGGYQIPFLKDLYTNSATQIVFNVSGEDAETVAKNWRWMVYPHELSAEHITALPRYQFYCRTFIGDEPHVAKVLGRTGAKRRFTTLHHRKTHHRCLEAHHESLIRESLQRWSADRNRVLSEILKSLS